MQNALERRGLLGVGAATLAVLGQRPIATEGKKKKKKKKRGGSTGFSKLGRGEETIFAVGDGAQEEGESLCPEGTQAMSGAVFLANTACDIVEYGPTDDTFTGWKVAISCPEGAEAEVNAVVAVCIS